MYIVEEGSPQCPHSKKKEVREDMGLPFKGSVIPATSH